MGYRFSLKNANSVGNLVEKNTISFLETTISSEEYLDPNIKFIEDFIFNTEKSLFSSFSYRSAINPRIRELQQRWPSIKDAIQSLYHNKTDEILSNKNILDFLFTLSSILANCRKKTLLLPGFGYNKLNHSLTDKSFLKELVKIHPGNSVLILQLTELFESSQIPLLNVFSKFDTAINKVDQWPGVLLWDDWDSVFVPVNSREEVNEIFTILKFESNALNYIKTKLIEKKSTKKYSYIFHLSDLHFGNKIADNRKLRVINMLHNHLSKLDDCSKAYPIITGDLVDSPLTPNKNAYSEFVALLTSKGFEEPVQILGNHDIDTGGFLKKLTSEKAVIQSLLNKENVEVIEELKLGIVKFNSNFGGQFAQGEIGQDQFAEIGNELDKLNRPDLTYIAILHHHPIVIENPEWYQKEWYESILGKIGYEYTMQLRDSEIFFDFLKKRDIRFALHGHKHIPKIHDRDSIQIISAGSTTGNIRHTEKGKTYLSYNVIKYDNELAKPLTCTIYAEDTLGAGPSNVIMKVFP